MNIENTANAIGKMILADKNHPDVIRYGKDITLWAGLLNAVADGKSLLPELLHWVSTQIKYLREPEGRDVWQTSEETMRKGTGDCEDMTILLCATALSLGIKVRFKIVATGETFDHIYPVLYEEVQGEWLAADPTADKPKLGWEVKASKRVVYGVNGGVYRIGTEIRNGGLLVNYAVTLAVIGLMVILILSLG